MARSEIKITDKWGGIYYVKPKKTEGYYRNIKTGEVQYLLDKCNGWRKLKP